MTACLLLLPLVVAFTVGSAKAEGLSVRAGEEWSCFFGGEQVTLYFDISDEVPRSGRASWSVSVESRVVARRESPFTTTPEKPGRIEISLNLPEVKPGVVLPADVAVEVRADDCMARIAKRIWIFPRDPFVQRRQSLDDLQITLFDPAKKTATVLEKSNVPARAIHNVDALAEITSGVILVGEGVSFREYRGLWNLLLAATDRGVSVICLAPAGGEIVLPGLGSDDLPKPAAIAFQQVDVIRRFDKRLDANAWPPDGRVVAARLALTGSRSGIQTSVSAENTGWPWFEATFAKPDARLIVCGFAIIEKWETGPTPRYLFARMLDSVSPPTETESPTNAVLLPKGTSP